MSINTLKKYQFHLLNENDVTGDSEYSGQLQWGTDKGDKKLYVYFNKLTTPPKYVRHLESLLKWAKKKGYKVSAGLSKIGNKYMVIREDALAMNKLHGRYNLYASLV